PFGQDRLIPIWVATLALRQKSREVRFDSAAQMLDFFRLPKDGFHYCRLVQAFKRIFGATIFFGNEEQADANMVIDWARFHFFDSMKLWYARGDRCSVNNFESDRNVITLSEAFYNEIDQHRIPVEREVVSSLAHAPGVLDSYLWVAWKAWTVNGSPSRIPITGHGGLCDQLGTVPYSVPRRFRHLVVHWLMKVKAYWPACPAVVTTDRRFLVVYSSRKSPAVCMTGGHGGSRACAGANSSRYDSSSRIEDAAAVPPVPIRTSRSSRPNSKGCFSRRRYPAALPPPMKKCARPPF
ncbi:MAG: replication protein RepA, partial [Terriglobia bacterium]